MYLDTAPATRHDDGRVERGERRWQASVSDDVVVSNAKSHTPGIGAGVCMKRALPVGRVARAWRASARRRSTDRPTWNVESDDQPAPPLPLPLRQDTRHKGRAGW